MTRIIILSALALFLVTPAYAGDDAKKSDDGARYELVYNGEFIDQGNEPISGVFPLDFVLYTSQKASKSIWNERHWVSVIDGTYSVILGSDSKLPEKAATDEVYLAVKLDGREMIRQPITAKLVSDEYRMRAVAQSGSVEYADRAGDAENLAGQPASAYAQREYVDRKLKEVNQGGGGAPAPASDGGPATLGTQTWKSEETGGSGGKRFILACPEGFVMTGMEGRSGAVIDGYRIVCTKLE